MARWIGDGYDARGEFRGTPLEYRPLPEFLRVQQTQRMVDSQFSAGQVYQAIQSRLITGDLAEWKEDLESLAEIWELVSGHINRERLRQDALNLQTGMAVLRDAPHLDQVSCEQCRMYWLDIETGEFAAREGTPLERDAPAPCEQGAQCPVGHWSQPRRLHARNRQTLCLYRSCRATGFFPHDPLFAYHASLIEQYERRAA